MDVVDRALENVLQQIVGVELRAAQARGQPAQELAMRAKQVIGSLATPGILNRGDGNLTSIFPRHLRFQHSLHKGDPRREVIPFFAPRRTEIDRFGSGLLLFGNICPRVRESRGASVGERPPAQEESLMIRAFALALSLA